MQLEGETHSRVSLMTFSLASLRFSCSQRYAWFPDIYFVQNFYVVERFFFHYQLIVFNIFNHTDSFFFLFSFFFLSIWEALNLCGLCFFLLLSDSSWSNYSIHIVSLRIWTAFAAYLFCWMVLLNIVIAVVRGLRPANGILLLHWTLQHSRMQWSRFIWIMLVIWYVYALL